LEVSSKDQANQSIVFEEIKNHLIQ